MVDNRLVGGLIVLLGCIIFFVTLWVWALVGLAGQVILAALITVGSFIGLGVAISNRKA